MNNDDLRPRFVRCGNDDSRIRVDAPHMKRCSECVDISLDEYLLRSQRQMTREIADAVAAHRRRVDDAAVAIDAAMQRAVNAHPQPGGSGGQR